MNLKLTKVERSYLKTSGVSKVKPWLLLILNKQSEIIDLNSFCRSLEKANHNFIDLENNTPDAVSLSSKEHSYLLDHGIHPTSSPDFSVLHDELIKLYRSFFQ